MSCELHTAIEDTHIPDEDGGMEGGYQSKEMSDD